MNRKSFLVGLLAAGCFVATSTLMTSPGNAQADPKVAKAMAILKAETAKLGEPKVEGTDQTADKTTAGLYFGSTKVNNDFTIVADPVGAGYVDSLARPGGNATGFAWAEYSIGGKWLEMLKEIAPRVTRAAVLRDAALAVGTGQFGAIQSVAPSFGVELTPVGVRDAEEIERGITAFAQGTNGGLIMTGSTAATIHRELIIALAARHRLPAVYFGRYFVTGGGLISYAPDYIDLFRRPASYVDRILKGEKPSELPVQNPTKYELVINLKTARTLGLTVPPTLLARADEVIE